MGAIYYNGIWYTQGKEGQTHTGFTPIGTIIAVMGKTVPMNYLACDGQIVNIADYPELATYFMTQFEASNYFGGDGVTTFAMPDLRGEFLRGSGTNSHTNQGNGSDVGEHQDGTEHSDAFLNHATDSNKYYLVFPYNSNNPRTRSTATNREFYGTNNRDTFYNVNKDAYVQASGIEGNYFHSFYTSRPTNTSVLYCIATKNIYMDPGCNYSTEEQVVGTWIDGKPIYQRTWTNTNFGGKKDAWTNTDITIENVAQLVSVNAYNFGSAIGYVNLSYKMNGTMLQYYSRGTTWTGISICTVKYTKTTDVVDI